MADYLWTGTEWSFPLLEKTYKAIEEIALNELGLDVYPNDIEIITSEQMVDAYSAVGMPINYHHWSFGKSFTQNWTSYQKGHQGLAYEIVINSNPCISYLMEENTMTMQALVIAHAAFGHNFFFKNNHLFKEWTDASSIIDYLVFAKNYIAQCEEREGREAVEKVLDSCHALMDYGVNPYKKPSRLSAKREAERNKARLAYQESRVNELFDTLIKEQDKDDGKPRNFPREPESNILYFCEKYSPDAPEWKREIIRIVRKISQYFYPQRQTQVMNEGCLVAGSLISTSDGLIPIEEIVGNRQVRAVWDGENWQKIYDWFDHAPKKRIKIKTHHGYTIHGGADHKVMIDGKWMELNQFKIGDTLPIDVSNETFAYDYVDVPPPDFSMRLTHPQISEATGIPISYYQSVKKGRHACSEARTGAFALHDQLFCEFAENRYDQGFETMTAYPVQLTEDFGYWLGVLIGDGSMSDRGRAVSIVNADQELLDNWKRIGDRLFGMEGIIEPVPEEAKTRIHYYSMALLHWLRDNLDIKVGYAAPIKEIPALVLRSPRSVVAAFLRGLFDADGCAANQPGGTVVYISRSEALATTVQQVLLQFGVISRIRQQNDLRYRLAVTGQDTAIFAKNVGFGLSRKQERLLDTISKVKRRRPRRMTTKVIAIEEDFGKTYDFSVSDTHRYVSGAFRHHNCATYVHYRIMNRLHEKGLMTDGNYLEFLHSHTSVVAQPAFNSRHYSGINPYALGFAMMQDIERICKEPTDEDRQWFPSFAGSGDEMAVLRDAWANYRDESFIRQFLSPKLIRDFGFFRLTDAKTADNYLVTAIHNDSGYEQVREALANNYERHAFVPQIEVIHMDPKSRTLSLRYTSYRGRTLDKTSVMINHVRALWGDTVYLYDADGRLIG